MTDKTIVIPTKAGMTRFVGKLSLIYARIAAGTSCYTSGLPKAARKSNRFSGRRSMRQAHCSR